MPTSTSRLTQDLRSGPRQTHSSFARVTVQLNLPPQTRSERLAVRFATMHTHREECLPIPGDEAVTNDAEFESTGVYRCQ